MREIQTRCSYTYDSNGNRLTKTLNGTTENYSYDDADKILTAGSKSFGYDAAGRRTSDLHTDIYR